MPNKNLEVKAQLDAELKQKFQRIKDRYALKSNADVIRFAINEEYRRLIKTPE